MQQRYYSNGKLLLTAEYGVLDGATSLAIPTKYGQDLVVTNKKASDNLEWKSFDQTGTLWFTATLSKERLNLLSNSNSPMGERLQKILVATRDLNPNFLKEGIGLLAETRLTFDRYWGLGSSSTLINNIAQWANVDPYLLLESTFGGSGYDIACAQHNKSILYKRQTKSLNSPKVQEVDFLPSFASDIYFIYLNKKQDSRLAIKNYKKQLINSGQLVESLTKLTYAILECDQLNQFQTLLTAHEKCLSEILELQPVKERFFSDYEGAIKSLGGWGGDFIMAVGNQKSPTYFKDRGFPVVIPYKDMALSH